MPSPTSFALFDSLPAELRLHVWKLSCQGRVVEVSYDPERDHCASPTSVPSILHACQESRAEALHALYKPAFGTKSHEPRIYFSRELDTLYIPRPPFMGYDDCARSFADLIRDTDDVVHLAIDYVSPAVKRPWETYNKYILMQSFRHAYQVILVVNTTDINPSGGSKGDWSLMDPVSHDDSDGDDTSCGPCQRILEEVKASFFYEVGGEFVIDEKGLAILEPLQLPSLVIKLKIRKY
jgi:hypothetical protein